MESWKMSGIITLNPENWSVTGNLIPSDVGSPTSTLPFTANDCSLTVLSAALIDGELLIPLQVLPDW